MILFMRTSFPSRRQARFTATLVLALALAPGLAFRAAAQAPAVAFDDYFSDSTGVPQMGAVVQLLRPDMTVLASVYTNSKGRFSFTTVLPGHYRSEERR